MFSVSQIRAAAQQNLLLKLFFSHGFFKVTMKDQHKSPEVLRDCSPRKKK
jgi:hypothetical protein